MEKEKKKKLHFVSLPFSLLRITDLGQNWQTTAAAKSSPPPVNADKVLLEHSQAALYGCFCTTTAWCLLVVTEPPSESKFPFPGAAPRDNTQAPPLQK